MQDMYVALALPDLIYSKTCQIIVYSLERSVLEYEAHIVSGFATHRNYKLSENNCSPFIVRSEPLRLRLLNAKPSTNRDMDLTCLEASLQHILSLPEDGDLNVRTLSLRIPVGAFNSQLLTSCSRSV